MKDLVRNPIGIIGLFISLIYGFANLLLGSTASTLTPAERWPIIIFIVVFPVIVLGAFYCLVARHHGKLYAPSDYKDDKSFLRTLSPEEREKKLEREAQEALPEPPQRAPASTATEQQAIQRRMLELQKTETSVISLFQKELGSTTLHRDVGIGNSGVSFDAAFDSNGKFTFLEIKSLRYPASMFLDRVLYNAVLAWKEMGPDFKLILAIVYHFDDKELARIESSWRRRTEKCPASIELRFIRFKDLNLGERGDA
jgi:hypothetical protein